MKALICSLLFVLPAAAAADVPAVTPARNAAAGYAVGNAGLADALVQVCGKLGEPVAGEIGGARAAWNQRNGAIVAASIRWIEHGIAQERAANGEASAQQMGDGIKAAIRQEVMTTLRGSFPSATDVNAEACHEWALALASPDSDLAANSRHGGALMELRAIVWPQP